MKRKDSQSKKTTPLWLNLGCGIVLAPKPFVNVDKYLDLAELKQKRGMFVNAEVPKGALFVQADLTNLPFEDNSAEYIESLDVIEHIPFKQVAFAITEMYRVLKPRGKLCLMTPNFDALAQDWVDEIKGRPFTSKTDLDRYLDIMQVVFGNQVHEGEFHKTPFNPFFLGNLLMGAGFIEQNIKMHIFPKGCTNWPPIKTKPKGRYAGKRCRAEYIWVEATK